MLKYIKYHAIREIPTIVTSFVINKLRHSKTWNSIDRINFIVDKIAKKYSLRTSLFSNFIHIDILDVKLRKNSSDIEVFYQIWIEEEYKKSIEIINEKILLSSSPIILDIGANIGMSAMYFKNKIQESNIFAFEPFESNLKRIPTDISSFQLALWNKQTKLNPSTEFRDGKAWSISMIEAPSGQIQGDVLSAFFTLSKSNEIDILKVDIEGAEFNAFINSTDNQNSLSTVKSVIMEIHDEVGSRDALYEIFTKNNFNIHELGELTLFLNEKYCK